MDVQNAIHPPSYTTRRELCQSEAKAADAILKTVIPPLTGDTYKLSMQKLNH